MTGRGLKIGLAISLALNLFVVGAVVAVLAARHQLAAHAFGADPIMSAADALPPGDRDAFRAMMTTTFHSLGPGLRDAFLARRDAMLQLQAEPLDRGAASADLARARMDDAAARARVEEAVLDFAAKLTPAERTIFARGLIRAARMRWMVVHAHGRTLTR